MERGGERPSREAQRLRTPLKEISRRRAESLTSPRPKAIPTRRRSRVRRERLVVATLAVARYSTSSRRAAWPFARRAPLD